MHETDEVKRALDYSIGDYVQVTRGKHAGDLGKIVDIHLGRNASGFIYLVYTADGTALECSKYGIRFLRHCDE